MANTITTLTSRIEEARTENKNPCKNYGSEKAAEKAVQKMADKVARHFSADKSNLIEVDYVIFFIESWGRWVAAVNMNGVLNNSQSTGGYIGLCAASGFFSY